MTTTRRASLVGRILLFLLAILFVMPVAIVFMDSVKPLGAILRNPLGLPLKPSLRAYAYVIDSTGYFTAVANTLCIAVCSIVLVILFSSACAYKLSRSGGKLSWVILMLFTSSMLIPFQTIMLPLTKLTRALGIVDSIPGLILTMVPLYAPFCVFMYHGFVKTIPIELEEAATIDGSGPFGTFFRIVFPLLSPATGSIVVLNALWAWNDFSLPLVLLQSAANKTITLITFGFFSSYSMRWDYALACVSLASLPIVVFYLFMQRYIIKGVVDGAVKG